MLEQRGGRPLKEPHMSDMAVSGVEIHTWDDLHKVRRRRADELNVSRNMIAEVAGLALGHSSKLLAYPPLKGFGRIPFDALLGALGLKLVAVEDPVGPARVRNQLTPRNRSQVRDGTRRRRPNRRAA